MKKEIWFPGETISASIGQGYNLVTPLQNASMISAIANGGFLSTPHLVKKIENRTNLKGDFSFKSQKINDKKINELFFKNLFKIGYRYFDKNKRTKKDAFIVKAFQRRFLPNEVTGMISEKTYIISHFLANHLKN